MVAVNKWDGLSSEQRDRVRRELDIKLPFLGFAELYFISALHGTAVGTPVRRRRRAYDSAVRKIAARRN